MVPTLTDSIKVAGLVLISDSSEDDQIGSSLSGDSIPDGSNGFLRRNGILTFKESIDL